MDIHPFQANAFTRIINDVQDDLKDLSDARDAARWDDDVDVPAPDPDLDTLVTAVNTLAGALDDLVNGRFDDGSDY